jgi:transposase-like protein
MKEPKTLIEAVTYFADPEVAEQYAAAIRWPNGVACPRMGCGLGEVAYLKNAHRWYCNDCKRKFTAKVNSVFEDSPISFSRWLPAIWMLANDRNGISSCELARALGVTQKTAWFMLHRIRRAIEKGPIEILSGEVESDETYLGPKQRGGLRPGGHHGRKSRGPAYGKQFVQGIVERKGEVRAFVVPNVERGTLVENIRKHVQPVSTVYTDALKSSDKLNDDFTHHAVNHSIEYVRGHVHTNNIEAFWSIFKRTLKGTYISPRPAHLQRYIEEQVYRFNERESEDGPRFTKVLEGADRKRLTYKALTGKS